MTTWRLWVIMTCPQIHKLSQKTWHMLVCSPHSPLKYTCAHNTHVSTMYTNWMYSTNGYVRRKFTSTWFFVHTEVTSPQDMSLKPWHMNLTLLYVFRYMTCCPKTRVSCILSTQRRAYTMCHVFGRNTTKLCQQVCTELTCPRYRNMTHVFVVQTRNTCCFVWS
jgi:hypothetical protein